MEKSVDSFGYDVIMREMQGGARSDEHVYPDDVEDSFVVEWRGQYEYGISGLADCFDRIVERQRGKQ